MGQKPGHSAYFSDTSHPIELNASCHCGSVKFRFESSHIHPFLKCYCSVCRKTQGGGGYAIAIDAYASSLKVEGREHIRVYRASTAERHFCGICSSGLWIFHPQEPEMIFPYASAVDTPLPRASDHTHMMTEFNASWSQIVSESHDEFYERFPDESIAQWHEERLLTNRR
jgi:hypothetical protein